MNRKTNYRDKEHLNETFADFMVKTGYHMVENYRMVKPNFPAAVKSILKYDRPQPVLNLDSWSISMYFLHRHFSPFLLGSSMISFQEAKDASEKQSATGYPTNIKFSTKAQCYTDPYFSFDEYFEKYWYQLAEPEMCMRPIWTCAQKVELRLVSKLRENKIRTFTASAMEHSLALNMFCFDFNNRFYGSNNRTWSCVGMTKYLGMWDRLYHRLNRHKKGWALDIGTFDASMFRAALEGQRDFRWEMMEEKFKTDENKQRFWNLYRDIIYSCIVMDDGTLLMKLTGNPSGSANTVVDNTMILFRLLAYCWIENVNSEYEDFQRFVEAALYGDDNTFTSAHPKYNAIAIRDTLQKLLIEVTTDHWEERPLKELDFLSNDFVWHDEHEMYLPGSREDRVLCSLKYGSGLNDIRWHYLRACNLRTDSWGNPKLRKIVQGYIEYLTKNYIDQLVGVVNGKNISEIMAMYKTDRELKIIYTGFEL